jgi:hypothetical protein
LSHFHASAAASTDSTGIGGWLTPALVVAVCALLFTVASFWWLNARQGRLKSYEPHMFSATFPSHMVRIRLPLIIYNTGPNPIVVQGLRLRFLDEPGCQPLGWVATRTQVQPSADDGPDFPPVFSVTGRTAYQLFAEFGAPALGFKLEKRDYRARVEVKMGHRQNWKTLLNFTLRASVIADPDSFSTYSNELGQAR